MQSAITRVMIDRYYKKVGAGDFDGLAALFADQFEWDIPGNKALAPWVGKRSTHKEVRDFYPDMGKLTELLKFEIHQTIVDGENGVVIGYLSIKINKNQALFNSPFVMHVQVVGNKIVKYLFVEDSWALSEAIQKQ